MPNFNNLPPEFLAQLNQMGLGPMPVGQTQGIPQPGDMPQGQFRNPIPQAGMGQMQQPMAPPQFPQLASFMPQGAQGQQAGPGQMPYISNQAMQQVLGPLMQPNYGVPMVSPYGAGAGQQPGQAPGLGGQMQIPRPVMQGMTSQGLGQWTPGSAASLRA